MNLITRKAMFVSAITLVGLAAVGVTSLAQNTAEQPTRQIGNIAQDATMTNSTTSTNSVKLNTFSKNYSPENTNARTLTAEDRLEIADLAARFNWAVDTRQYDALAELFTSDGVLDHDWGYVKGGSAIVNLIRSHEADEDGVRHETTNYSITVAEDGTATMLGYLVATWVGANPASGPSAPYIIAHGVQTFTLRKENGDWKIARLTLDQTVVNAANVPDKAIRDQISSTAEERAKRNGWY